MIDLSADRCMHADCILQMVRRLGSLNVDALLLINV